MREPAVTKFSSKRPLTDAEEAEVQAMIASDPDAPELTDEQARTRLSFADAMKRGRSRPALPNAREPVTLRLEAEVIDRFKAKGEDWRAIMAKTLKDAS